METKKAKFAVVNTTPGDKSCCIKLTNERPSIQPLFDSLYEDAEIVFNDNNSITLTGNKWQFGIEFQDVYPSELDYEVHPNYIELTKFRKKPIVRHGWHRKAENKFEKITFSNYQIIE